METGARGMTPVGATAERRVGQSMSMEEMDAYFERCWKNGQRRQKLDPSGSKRKTAEGFTFGRLIPHSETVANLERAKRETAQLRAELEAEMAACSISSPPQPPASSPPPPPPPPPPGRRRLTKKSRE